MPKEDATHRRQTKGMDLSGMEMSNGAAIRDYRRLKGGLRRCC
jgi:hypothetical protein